MQINYFEGRIRLRDKALRDEELRKKALEIAEQLCAVSTAEYNEKTASILIEYAPESVDKTLVQALAPCALKLRRLLERFKPASKDEILAELTSVDAVVKAAKKRAEAHS